MIERLKTIKKQCINRFIRFEVNLKGENVEKAWRNIFIQAGILK
ncbi:DUF3983 domain-containing protein [Bacillus thuringiensis]|nr:DUF3983 domain-containing protein [Bacillus thuringiensis]EEM44192.1 hypothetical protein bthur0005_61040 [Bacillus thuringiensis serovar pakistani str. T13001]EKS8373639.1 DUF3983 domain-containing protein [Bacillus cereus]